MKKPGESDEEILVAMDTDSEAGRQLARSRFFEKLEFSSISLLPVLDISLPSIGHTFQVMLKSLMPK